MTQQYNLAMKLIDPSVEFAFGLMQSRLSGYDVFTNRYGNLDGTAFSKENLPYVGDVFVMMTIKPEALRVAQDVLSREEWLQLFSPTISNAEDQTGGRFEDYRA